MHTVKLLTNLVEHHQVLAYILIFFGLIFEGEVVIITTGILIHLGAITGWIAVLFILAGAVFKIFFGYNLGRFFFNKCSEKKFVKYVDRKVSKIMPRFKEKPFWSLFISKFITGANYWVIVYSGYHKINLRTYLKAEFLSTVIWAPLLLSLGYVFSYTALHVSREITKFTLIVVLFTIGFVLLDKFAAFLYWLFEEFEVSQNKDDEIIPKN